MPQINDPASAPSERSLTEGPKPKPPYAPVRPHARAEQGRHVPPPPEAARIVTTAEISQHLNERASQLNPGLIQRNPSVAASLLTGPTPTVALGRMSHTIGLGMDLMAARTALSGVPGALLPYYTRAQAIPDPTARTAALDILDNLRNLPEDQQVLAAAVLQNAGATVGEGQPVLGEITKGVGTAVSLPFTGSGYLLSETAKLLESLASHVPFVGNDTAASIDVARRGVGYVAKSAGEGSMYGLRVLEGAAGAGLAALEGNLSNPANPEDLITQIGHYVPSWSDFQAGEHSGLTKAVFELNGDDPANDPGMADALDLGFDLLTGEAIARTGMALKESRLPLEGGGLRTGQDFTSSYLGKRVVTEMQATIDTAPEGQTAAILQDRFAHLDPQFAKELARSSTKADVARAIEQHVDDVPSQERFDALNAELADIREAISRHAEREGDVVPSGAVTTDLESLRVEEAALEQRITDLSRREPAWAFPRRSRIQAILRDAPRTRTERVLHFIYSGVEAVGLDLKKLTDDLSPKDLKLFNPSVTDGLPPDWASHNFDLLRKQFNIAKVSKETSNRVLTDMMEIVTDQDYFTWRKEVSAALEEGLTRGGKRDLTPQAQQAIRFSDRDLVERRQSPYQVEATLADGTTATVTKNVLETADGSPIPTQPNEFAGHTFLPDIDLLRDASSNIRAFDRWARHKPVIGKVYGVLRAPVDVAKFVTLTLPRLILKPLLLDTRIVPMGVKIQIDQGLRNFALGMKPLDIVGRRDLDFLPAGIPVDAGLKALLPDGDATALGTVAESLVTEAETITLSQPTKFVDPILQPKVADAIGYGIFDAIQHLRTDDLARRVALQGPEEVLRYLEANPDSYLGKWYAHDMKPLLDANGISPEMWLANKDAQISQITGSDPALRRAIGTGHWDISDPMPTGEALELDMRVRELEDARAAALDQTDPTVRLEYERRVEVIQAKVERLQAQQLTRNRIDITDSEAVSNRVLNNWQQDTFDMPREVTIQRKAYVTDTAKTLPAKLNEYAIRLNRTLYKGLTPLSKADVAMTRGSTFYQMLEKSYGDLVQAGYDPETAFRVGQHRAAFIAKDLHYDIGARSSFDRATKDLFWFAPVVREQLLTWLVKIPSESYWALGFPARAGEAHALIGGLEELGILRQHTYYDTDTETEKTELVLHVPWVSDFIAGVLKSPTAGDMRVSSLNPVTAGGEGYLPTLAPGAESILDMTARHAPDSMRPFLDFLARNLEFDKSVTEGPSYIPSVIRYGLELLGLHVPFDTFSADQWREVSDKANTQAVRWAMSDLASEGTKPPGAGATTEQLMKYRDLVDERAGYYRSSLAVVHLMGSALFPGSFTTPSSGVTQAGEAFYRWRDKLDPNLPSDEYFSAVDAYVKGHPGAFAYTVGAYDRAGSYGTPAFDDKTPLTPDEYFINAMKSAAWQDDAPAEEPVTPQGFSALSDRQKQQRLALWALGDPAALEPVQATSLGFPEFDGRHHLLETVATINAEFDKHYSSELPDDKKQKLYASRDAALEKAAEHYGPEGKATLDLIRATPAERMQHAEYFTSRDSSNVIAEAASIARKALARGSSPLFAAESTGVLAAKVDLYQRLERMRREDTDFDREMRRASIATGETGVALYEAIFFGQPDNAFDYQSSIIRAMRSN